MAHETLLGRRKLGCDEVGQTTFNYATSVENENENENENERQILHPSRSYLLKLASPVSAMITTSRFGRNAIKLKFPARP
jgi:hypothetical protein